MICDHILGILGEQGGPKWHFGPKKWPKMVPYRTTKSVLGSWLPQINFGWCMNHMWRYIINVRRGGQKSTNFAEKSAIFPEKVPFLAQNLPKSPWNHVWMMCWPIEWILGGGVQEGTNFAGKIAILPENCHFSSCTGSEGVICMSHAFFQHVLGFCKKTKKKHFFITI